jgi:nucleotide-binding universal stress UspA family protein
MFETVVLATDGSESAERAVTLALDFADRFDATLHACYVVATDDPEDSPERAGEALAGIEARTEEVHTEIREGDPASEICAYAAEIDADLVVTGTRGRHGEHGYLIGSVAEAVVENSPAPVLTARQLASDAHADVAAAAGE